MGDGEVTWTIGTGNGITAEDFQDLTGTVSFTGNETSRTITVKVKGDVVIESNEQFTVALSNATGGAQIGTATASGTILNDDQPVAAPSSPSRHANAASRRRQSGTTDFTFTVTRANTAGANEVTWTIADRQRHHGRGFRSLDRQSELHRQRDTRRPSP